MKVELSGSQIAHIIKLLNDEWWRYESDSRLRGHHKQKKYEEILKILAGEDWKGEE